MEWIAAVFYFKNTHQQTVSKENKCAPECYCKLLLFAVCNTWDPQRQCDCGKGQGAVCNTLKSAIVTEKSGTPTHSSDDLGFNAELG